MKMKCKMKKEKRKMNGVFAFERSWGSLIIIEI